MAIVLVFSTPSPQKGTFYECLYSSPLNILDKAEHTSLFGLPLDPEGRGWRCYGEDKEEWRV